MSKVIYQPTGRAGEYSELAANFFTSCSNGCLYCYLKQGPLAKNCGGDTPKLKTGFKDSEAKAIQIFEKQLKKDLTELQKKGLFFSFTTDACLPETIGLTIEAVRICQDNNVPVKILTKADIMTNDKKGALLKMQKKHLIGIGYTLTGHDKLEPNAYPNKDRIKQMKEYKELGFQTFASIEPIVDFPSAKKVIAASQDFCDLYLIGLNDRWKSRYKVQDAKDFIIWLKGLNKPKIYLKETLMEFSGYKFNQLGRNFVKYDYRMFPMFIEDTVVRLF